MTPGMKEVSKQEYYDYIGDKDLVYSVWGDYPYTGLWKDRYGNLHAKRIESYPPDALWPLVDKFFIKS